MSKTKREAKKAVKKEIEKEIKKGLDNGIATIDITKPVDLNTMSVSELASYLKDRRQVAKAVKAKTSITTKLENQKKWCDTNLSWAKKDVTTAMKKINDCKVTIDKYRTISAVSNDPKAQEVELQMITNWNSDIDELVLSLVKMKY